MQGDFPSIWEITAEYEKSGDGSGLKEAEGRNILNGVKILYKKIYNRKIWCKKGNFIWNSFMYRLQETRKKCIRSLMN